MNDFIVTTLSKEGVFTITLNYPQKMNCMGFEMLYGIEETVNQAKTNNAIKCVLFKGAGNRAFSSGANIKEFAALKDDEVTNWITLGNDIFNKIETLNKPTVAYIDGYAMGGGFELALACDFRLATHNTLISLPEVSNGWLPGWGGMTRIRKLVGEANAKRVVLLSERFNATDALSLNLVTKIVAEKELPEFLEKLINIKPAAYKLAKSALMDTTRTTYGSDVDFDVLAVHISK